MHTNICFSRRTNLAWHIPAQTLANSAATAFLTNTCQEGREAGRGSCADGSRRRRTRTSPPGHGPLLHSLLSGLSGHTCCHTESRLDFHSTRESVAGLKDKCFVKWAATKTVLYCVITESKLEASNSVFYSSAGRWISQFCSVQQKSSQGINVWEYNCKGRTWTEKIS